MLRREDVLQETFMSLDAAPQSPAANRITTVSAVTATARSTTTAGLWRRMTREAGVAPLVRARQFGNIHKSVRLCAVWRICLAEQREAIVLEDLGTNTLFEEIGDLLNRRPIQPLVVIVMACKRCELV